MSLGAMGGGGDDAYDTGEDWTGAGDAEELVYVSHVHFDTVETLCVMDDAGPTVKNRWPCSVATLARLRVAEQEHHAAQNAMLAELRAAGFQS